MNSIASCPLQCRVRRRHGHRLRTLGALTTVAALACSCALSPPSRSQDFDHTAVFERQTLPALTVGDVMAPIDGSSGRELEHLARLPNAPSVQLRRAFVLLSRTDAEGAQRELNQLLFQATPPTPEVRSFAYYLRGLAAERRGDREGFSLDLAEASKTASEPALRRLIDARRGAAAEAAAPPAVATAEFRATTMGRAAWNARAAQPRGMVPMGAITRITVHHSAVFTSDTSAGGTASAVLAIQKAHMNGSGWADIGYHYLIDRAGRVIAGRSLQWQGAHAGDPERNRGNVGICLLGNFVSGSSGQRPSAQQLATLRGLVESLCRGYHVTPDHIFTHRELKETACPGPYLQVAVDQLRRDLSRRDLVATPE